MIFDSVQRKERYKDFPMLYQALCFLQQLPSGELPQAQTVLIEGQLFCNPVTLTSKPEAECIYEAHRRYIDLHYIVSGAERIATSDVDALTSRVPYSAEKDIEFLEGKADGVYTLKPGQFMVCFPHDAHKVAIMEEQPSEIRKVVFKMKVQEQDL